MSDRTASIARLLSPSRDPICGSIDIAAPIEAVRALVHDPVRMALLGEEINHVRFLDGATAPAVGVRFRGANRNGLRRWTTTCTITDYSDTRFGFRVVAGTDAVVLPISRWQYDLESLGPQATRLTETNWIIVPQWFVPIAVTVTGVADRERANAEHIARTLHRVRAAVES